MAKKQKHILQYISVMYFLITMSENSRTIKLFTNHFLLFCFKLSDENFNNAKESVKKEK